ncbi:glycosyltransferase family 2 protein [Shinella zoogloeoides]|uniref:glycosyltransferase family 2 protein n=1 Tax=Shinella zoogloeoides TaxID=352475 RepID=UPI001F5A4E98|nr:glycosyltransferase family 2 protein [Shinella zoogloeoides]
MSLSPEISIIVPCYNEAQGLKHFWARLCGVMKSLGSSWEAIFINDGSRDETIDILAGLKPPIGCTVHIIDFSRNFGKEAAVTAGLDNAAGQCAVVIDADLQHPPETIATMVEEWRKGAEVVLCKRSHRKSDPFLRTWFSNRFYKLSSRLFEVKIPQDVGDFRLMDRVVVEALFNLRENQRFMKGIFAWIGFRSVTIEFDVADREHGTSSFNLWKLLNFAVDGITSFTTVPLRLWFYIGFFLSILSLAYGTSIVFNALVFGNPVPGYPSLAAMVAFLGGIQLIGIGVLGEYIGRIFREVKRRPIYVVRRRTEIKNDDG